jgi:hypothetical protein
MFPRGSPDFLCFLCQQIIPAIEKIINFYIFAKQFYIYLFIEQIKRSMIMTDEHPIPAICRHWMIFFHTLEN